jgi:tetratricopeptide (TPR) repeat protein
MADLGEVQLIQGKEKEAEENFQQALSLAEEKTVIYVKIVSAYLNQNQPQQAVEIYLKARKSSRTVSLFARELAEIYKSLNQTEKALQEYFNYYQEDSNRAAEVESAVKNLKEKEENLPVVERFLRRKVQESPKDYLAYRLLGDLYLEKGEYQKALVTYESLDQIVKAEGELLLSFAESCVDKEELSTAEQGANLVLQKYPESVNRISANFLLVEIYQKQKKYDPAVQILDQILTGQNPDKDKVQALYWSGLILFQKKDFSSALVNFRDLSMRPALPYLVLQAQIGMGNSYLALGKSDSALIAYRKVAKQRMDQTIEENLSFRLAEMFFFTQVFDSAYSYYDRITQKNLRSPLANDALERMKIIAENKSLDSSGLSRYAQIKWLVYQGKEQEALQELGEIRLSSQGLAEIACIEEARIQMERQNWKESLAPLEELIQKYPEGYFVPLALKLSADLYSQRLGQPQMALELYQKILKEHPQALFLDQVRQKIKTLTSQPKGS